jgi:hypothetical protein
MPSHGREWRLHDGPPIEGMAGTPYAAVPE